MARWWWPFGERSVARLPDASAVERKASEVGALIAGWNIGQPVYTPRNYDQLTKEGFEKCSVVFRCVSLIARSVASIPWYVMRGAGKAEVEKHPVLELLARPNPHVRGGEGFIESFIMHYAIAGNAYMEAVAPTKGPPKELWEHRPSLMRVIPGKLGMPVAYEFTNEGRTKRWQVDLVNGRSPILHFKSPHPGNFWYGFSPIEAAANAIDQANAIAAHNLALHQNGGRPGGIVTVKPQIDKNSGRAIYPPPEQLQSIKDRLGDTYTGPDNAGKLMVVGGEIEWVQTQLSPQDMDYINSKMETARDICLAFGVPHVLVVAGESTYNNRADARLEFWDETIIPIANRLRAALNDWLMPMYGDDAVLMHDLDGISALEPRRESKFRRVVELYAANLITREEARIALDYPERPTAGEFKDEAAPEPFGDMSGARGDESDLGDTQDPDLGLDQEPGQGEDIPAEGGKKYNPNQPREPAGTPIGGRWARSRTYMDNRDPGRGEISVAPTSRRTWRAVPGQTGYSHKNALDRQSLGRVGEDVALAYIRDMLGDKNAYIMSRRTSRFPVDIVSPKYGWAVEVKSGQPSTTRGGQCWRVWVGQDSGRYASSRRSMSIAQIKRTNAKMVERALAAKTAVVKKLSREVGRNIKAKTMGLVINPETRTADIFVFDGFHALITWRERAGYRGGRVTVEDHHAASVKYGKRKR